MVTRSPLACNNLANEAAMIPFPNEEVTPPVTKTYLAMIWLIDYDKLKLVIKSSLFRKGKNRTPASRPVNIDFFNQKYPACRPHPMVHFHRTILLKMQSIQVTRGK